MAMEKGGDVTILGIVAQDEAAGGRRAKEEEEEEEEEEGEESSKSFLDIFKWAPVRLTFDWQLGNSLLISMGYNYLMFSLRGGWVGGWEGMRGL